MTTRKLSIGATLFFCLFLSYSRSALQSLSLYFDKPNFTRHHLITLRAQVQKRCLVEGRQCDKKLVEQGQTDLLTPELILCSMTTKIQNPKSNDPDPVLTLSSIAQFPRTSGIVSTWPLSKKKFPMEYALIVTLIYRRKNSKR